MSVTSRRAGVGGGQGADVGDVAVSTFKLRCGDVHQGGPYLWGFKSGKTLE